MSLVLLFGLALGAEPCDLPAAVQAIRDDGAEEAYQCLSASEQGDELLREAIPANAGNNQRLTRAMAIWLLARRDMEWSVANTSMLQPADVRLLSDGIKAARGRRSPVPEHQVVFERLGWYRPLANYTDGRLRPVDHANLALLLAEPVTEVPLDAAPAPSGGAARVVVPSIIGGAALLGAAFAIFRFRRP